MKSWRALAPWGPIRALIVVCLLAGVFAMHGLTGSHDATVAVSHRTPLTVSTQAAMHQAPWQSAHHAIVHRMSPANESATAARSSQASPVYAGTAVDAAIAPASHGHLHAMGDVCLAMLTALALAMVAALAVRGLQMTHPVVLPSLAVPSIARTPSPPWLQPSLSKLCVLRT